MKFFASDSSQARSAFKVEFSIDDPGLAWMLARIVQAFAEEESFVVASDCAALSFVSDQSSEESAEVVRSTMKRLSAFKHAQHV